MLPTFAQHPFTFVGCMLKQKLIPLGLMLNIGKSCFWVDGMGKRRESTRLIFRKPRPGWPILSAGHLPPQRIEESVGLSSWVQDSIPGRFDFFSSLIRYHIAFWNFDSLNTLLLCLTVCQGKHDGISAARRG